MRGGHLFWSGIWPGIHRRFKKIQKSKKESDLRWEGIVRSVDDTQHKYRWQGKGGNVQEEEGGR